MPPDIIQSALRQQGVWCADFGSPFTAALCNAMADDYAQGGIVADILAGWSTNPLKDALALRLTGALHYIALSEPDGTLAAVWPHEDRVWSFDAAWASALTHLCERSQWVRAFIKSPPQTNEVRRSVALFPGLCVAAADFDGPVDVLELGASAGLNLSLDQFTYQAGAWSCGDAIKDNVMIDTDWSGRAPDVSKSLSIRHRAACDQNPLNAANPDDARLLTAYVWPDQPARLARLKSAIALAVANKIVPDKADAADWLVDKLATRAKDALTIVYHSVFLIYPDNATRDKIDATMEAAGNLATPQAPLAWLRFEAPHVLGLTSNDAFNVLELIQWPGGKRTVLANVDPHGRTVDWLV